MLVRLTKAISFDAGRRDLAGYLSRVIEAAETVYFVPYMPNAGDTSYWTVDGGNDWKVRFFDAAPTDFEIIHRYNNQTAIDGLSAWVAHRLGGKVLQPIPEEGGVRPGGPTT